MKNFAELYDDIWKDHKFTNWSRFQHTLTLIPKLPAGAQIFDIAAGPGRFTDYLLSQTSYIQKDQITSFEISPVALEQLQNKGYRAQLLDIEKTPAPDQADLVFFLESIEHIIKPDEVIKNLYQSLKPGGYLIISTPNYASVARRMRMLFGVIPEMYTSDNHHISLFSVWLLKERLRAAGFIIDKENNLFQMESLGRIFYWIRPLIPHYRQKFPFKDYNYVPISCLPNLLSDLVLIRAYKPHDQS